MRISKTRIWGAVLTIVAAASAAEAMTVAPMQIEMVSAGARSHAQISVVNNSDQPLPLEAVIARLSLDENGRQTTTRAGEDFLVMPPQALIPPGATQNFRLQWLGDPLMAQSQSFLVYMNQIPVKLPKAKSAVQVVMSVGVMVNVAPAQGSPALQVVSTMVTVDGAGRRYPTLTVQNTSNVHALLPQAVIHLSAAGWSSTLASQTLSDRIGIGLVQPGKRRVFKLPVEVPANVSTIQTDLEMPAKRR